MDVTQLIRDGDYIIETFKEVGDTLVTTTGCSLFIPESYVHGELGDMGDVIKIVGIHGIVVGDKFGVSDACALMQIAPSSTITTTINGTKYLEFIFEAGEIVYTNLNLVKVATLVFRIYNEIIAMGKVPWYLGYEDMLFLFKTSLLHGGANLDADSALLELIATHMARNPQDIAALYRFMVNKFKPEERKPPHFIPLKNIAFGTTNTTSKLVGNMFGEGVTSALVTQSTQSEQIETLLRGE
jgi:hypothetical protein